MKKKERRRIKELLKKGTLVLTEDFTPCDIRAYSITTVITTHELWVKHLAEVVPNCIPNFGLIIL